MSAGTYAAAAAALGLASEATGTTAFTPLGEQAREQGHSGPSVPQVPDAGMDIGEVLAAVQAAQQGAQQGAQRGDVNVDLSGLAALAQQGQQDGLPAAATELMAEYRRQAEEARERAEEARRRAEAASEGDVDGDGESDVPEISLPDWMTEPPGQGSDPEPDQGSDPDDFRLQDLDGRGPFGIGTWLAAGGEIGAAAEDTGSKGVDFATDVGNTYLQGYKALRGQEYSAEDTLAEDIHGTGTRRVNWDDHLPSLPDVDLPGGGDDNSSSGSGGQDDGNKFERMTADVTGGLSAHLPGVSDGQPSGSDDGGDDDPEPLPEELRRRLGGPTDLPAGGL